MAVLRPERIAADRPELRAALVDARLPVDDLSEPGRTFFRLWDQQGTTIGFGGLEVYGTDVLLRSVVVLPRHRSQGLGRRIVDQLLRLAHEAGARQAYLLTGSAAPVFIACGFAPLDRSQAPAAILATRQAMSICSSASLLTKTIAASHD